MHTINGRELFVAGHTPDYLICTDPKAENNSIVEVEFDSIEKIYDS